MKSDRKNISFPLAVDPDLGILAEENGHEEHIKQLIKQVLLTNPGERINRPDFGCGIRQMIFAPNSDINAALLQLTIVQSLDKWLGDLIITDEVKAWADNEKLKVAIAYTIHSTREQKYLNIEIDL